jgi:hypothetical protein
MYFHNDRVLNRRQARWARFLTRFDFIIVYRPGALQGKADALSRRSYIAPCLGEAAFDHPNLNAFKYAQQKYWMYRVI